MSNCDFAPSNRQKYVTELSKHITVDIYGKNPECSKYRCPTEESNSTSNTYKITNSSNSISNNSINCIRWLGEQYKFYLAFENSNCRQYITEKFFTNALE